MKNFCWNSWKKCCSCSIVSFVRKLLWNARTVWNILKYHQSCCWCKYDWKLTHLKLFFSPRLGTAELLLHLGIFLFLSLVHLIQGQGRPNVKEPQIWKIALKTTLKAIKAIINQNKTFLKQEIAEAFSNSLAMSQKLKSISKCRTESPTYVLLQCVQRSQVAGSSTTPIQN